MRNGLIAELATPEALVAAILALREKGYERIEVFTPYPLLEVEEALAMPRSVISRVVFFGGLLGALIGFGVQWGTNAVDYPLNVGAFAPGSVPAFVPITFETTILLAGLSAFLGFFVLSRLPRWWSPVFEIEGFERASIDRFFLAVDARDRRFNTIATAADLRNFEVLRVEAFGEP